MRYFVPIFISTIVIIVSILGFRGDLTKNTPIEVFPDMDRQAKYKAQTSNDFYANNQADRLPVAGTFIRGNGLNENNVFSASPTFHSDSYKTGKDKDGSWIDKIPTEANPGMKLMRLGKEKYDIHCSICHGEYGNGQGVTSKFGIAARNLSDSSNSGTYLESAARWTDGQIFHAISNGSASGIMLGLKDKLTPTERWAIVLYLRALQEYVSEATVNSSQNKGGGS